MNRIFEDRKSTKPRITSRENKAIIKALDMYGRVPEQWELLEEIERLNNIIDELENYLNEQVDYMTHHSIERMVAFGCCRYKLQELKGSDKE